MLGFQGMVETAFGTTVVGAQGLAPYKRRFSSADSILWVMVCDCACSRLGYNTLVL